jgi:hypothetical protein
MADLSTPIAHEVDTAALRAAWSDEVIALRAVQDAGGEPVKLDGWLAKAGALNKAMRAALPALLDAYDARLSAKRAEVEGERTLEQGVARFRQDSADEDGRWATCSGCHESEDGYDVGHYPFSEALGCKLGGGCRECGGVGAIWDTTDWSDFADWSQQRDRDRETIKAVLVERLRVFDGRVVNLDDAADDILALKPGTSADDTFQQHVAPWMQACFGPAISADCIERGDRFLEEALELLQSGGYDRARVATLVDYVYGRPAGVPAQEVGGVMVTLAAYCLAAGLDMHEAGAAELTRISDPATIERIRAKQASKRGLHTPLPCRPSEVGREPNDG